MSLLSRIGAARVRSAARNLIRVFAALVVSSPASLTAMPIDLHDLFHDPGAPISIAADGSSATFTEDASVFAVFLSNVPGLGDPRLITRGAFTLSFDYLFAETPNDADLFHFAMLDGNTGAVLAPFELFVFESATGQASFDLSLLPVATLGFQFELIPDLLRDRAFGAALTIANLRLEAHGTVLVDAAVGSLPVLILMLAAMVALTRRVRPLI